MTRLSKRRDEIPVLWDDLDADQTSTRLRLPKLEFFSGVFSSSRAREEEKSAADLETVRIPRDDACQAFERLFAEEFVETIARPPRTTPVPRARTTPPPRPTPRRPAQRKHEFAPEWAPTIDPLAPPPAPPPIDPFAATVAAIVREPVPPPEPRRRSLIPWATLFMGLVVGAGVFSDEVKDGHMRYVVDLVASFVDPALVRPQ